MRQTEKKIIYLPKIPIFAVQQKTKPINNQSYEKP